MSTTITIRADKSLRDALVRKAKLERKTVSEVIRQILQDALVERPLAERLGRTRGSLRIADDGGAWQRRIRERNWRP